VVCSAFKGTYKVPILALFAAVLAVTVVRPMDWAPKPNVPRLRPLLSWNLLVVRLGFVCGWREAPGPLLIIMWLEALGLGD